MGFHITFIYMHQFSLELKPEPHYILFKQKKKQNEKVLVGFLANL